MPRICRTCEVSKPLNRKHYRVGYVRKSDGRPVFNRECLECAYAARREYYGENKVIEILKVLEWQKSHPENKRIADRVYYSKNKKKFRDYSFAKHGLSVAVINQLLESQDYRCAVCRQLFDESTDVKSYFGFSIDHDHRCCSGDYGCARCVRGLLCSLCNRGLGFLRDDPIVVRLALEYLESYERRRANGDRPEQHTS